MNCTTSCGIYLLYNRINGKRYIGSSINLPSRKRTHLYELRHNKHKNQDLQLEFNSYGEDAFDFVLLFPVKNKEDLLDIEQQWLDWCKPEYNINPDTRNDFSWVDTKSEDELEKITNKRSEIMKRLWQDPEYRANFSKKNKGRISNRKGVKLSEKTKEKLRQANLGENNPNYGLKRSQETVDKMVKTYEGAISPEGDIYSPVISLTDFCREFNLSISQMARVFNGKAKSHRGWTRV